MADENRNSGPSLPKAFDPSQWPHPRSVLPHVNVEEVKRSLALQLLNAPSAASNLMPVDADGVPYGGPFRDHVRAAEKAAADAELARFQQRGILDPDSTKAAIKTARTNAISQWRADHPDE